MLDKDKRSFRVLLLFPLYFSIYSSTNTLINMITEENVEIQENTKINNWIPRESIVKNKLLMSEERNA